MAVKTFPACMDFVLKQEGGLSMDRYDPGNCTGGRVGKGVLKGTNMGIAANSFPDIDIAHLTRSKAEEIYRANYCQKIDGDILPPGIDLVVFDFAVNSDLEEANAWRRELTKPKQAPVDFIRDYCGKRLSLLRGLSTWSRYGDGWNKSVIECEAEAIKMAGGKPAVTQRPATQNH